MIQEKIFRRRGAEAQRKSLLGVFFCMVSLIPYGIGVRVFLRASASLRRILSILFASAVLHG